MTAPLRSIALLAVLLATQARAQSVLDAVFNGEQVQRGKAVYSKNCQACHSNNLQGEGIEPPLIGELFVDQWREDKLASLYDFMQTRMPKEGRNTTPGSLQPQQYLDVLVYVLDRNGYPSGADELKAEQLATTQFVGLNGPAPLPPSAMVRVVGCLVANGDSYTLAQAGAITRVRVADETDAHEIALSQAAPLGDTMLVLGNAERQSGAAALAGKKVQAKGVLNQDNGASRLNVLSLVAAGAECPRR